MKKEYDIEKLVPRKDPYTEILKEKEKQTGTDSRKTACLPEDRKT